MCPSQSTTWANTEFPKEYIKNIFNFSPNRNRTKIWFDTLFSLEFYRWLYLYLKNCRKTRQKINSSNLYNLSAHSFQCLHEILEENSIEFSQYTVGTIQLAKDETQLKRLSQVSEFDKINKKIVLTKDEIIEKENLLENVKDELYGGVYNTHGTNGNMYEFCIQLKNLLIEKYNVQFLFNEEIKQFFVSNQTNSKQHIDGFITEKGTIISSIDNLIVANGNFVRQLMKKINIYIPVYPIKVFYKYVYIYI